MGEKSFLPNLWIEKYSQNPLTAKEEEINRLKGSSGTNGKPLRR